MELLRLNERARVTTSSRVADMYKKAGKRDDTPNESNSASLNSIPLANPHLDAINV